MQRRIPCIRGRLWTAAVLAAAAGTAIGSPVETAAKRRAALRRIPGIVRYYSFAETAPGTTSVRSLAGEQEPAVWNGDEPLWIVDGRLPGTKAVRLNKGVFAAKPFVPSKRGFSVCFWFRKHGPGAYRGNNGAPNGTLVSVGIGYWDGWRVTTSYPQNDLGFEIGRPKPINSVMIRTADGAPDAAWVHVAATWDRHRMMLYINGFPASERDYDGAYTPPRTDAQFKIGYADFGWGSVIQDVDEVLVLDRALSPSEVVDVMFAGEVSPAAVRGLAQASEHLAEGRSEAALGLLHRTITNAAAPLPVRRLARLASGIVLKRLERLPDALEALSPLVAADVPPDVSRMAAEHALAICRTGSVPTSSAVFERILKLPGVSDADRIRFRRDLAAALMRERRFEHARVQWRRLLTAPDVSNAEQLDIRLRIAHSYRAEHRWEDAVRAYRSLASAESAPPEYRSYARLCAAQVLDRAGLLREAAAECRALASVSGAPPHLVTEAHEYAAELDRARRGLPRRDPAAHRLPAPKLPYPGVEFHVAPDGDDANPGTAERPFATLERARDAVRALKRAPSGLPPAGAAVIVHDGRFLRRNPLDLDAQDSGEPGRPIVWRAAPGEHPVLYGGVRVEAFRAVTDPAVLARLPADSRGKVVEADLRAQGVVDYGKPVERGFGKPAAPALEVWSGDRALPCARWPDAGFLRIRRVISGGSRTSTDKTVVFECPTDRLQRWRQADDAWLFGYWRHHWADNRIPMVDVDPEHHRITAGGRGAYGVRAGQRFYVYNLLEEINRPGEWHLDRRKGVLYLCPPSDAPPAVELSMLETPFLKLDHVKHAAVIGLTLDCGRFNGAELNECEDVLLAGCTLRRVAGDGILIRGGRKCIVLGCDLEHLGRGGLRVQGGDRKTLTHGGHVIENTCVHDFSRIDRTYTPAVWMDGVGNVIRHNLFFESPHHAIRLEGNDHLVEYNEIHSVVWEADDQGGLDMWGDPTYRGNVIRWNYWRHIGSGLDRAGQAGVRLDDAISGVLIYGNVFYRCSGGHFGGLQIHGGKENIVDNNLFVACKYAVSFSPWGARRWHAFLRSPRIRKRLYEIVDIRKPPYSTRYPALARLEADPDVNMLWRNVAVDCGRFTVRDRGVNRRMDNLVLSGDPGFADLQAGNLALRPDSQVYDSLGFRPIPFAEIGLYKDVFRASWPPASPESTH